MRVFSMVSGGMADGEAKAEFLRLFVQQQDGENLVVDDTTNQFGNAPQEGVEIKRGVDHIGHFQKK